MFVFLSFVDVGDVDDVREEPGVCGPENVLEHLELVSDAESLSAEQVDDEGGRLLLHREDRKLEERQRALNDEHRLRQDRPGLAVDAGDVDGREEDYVENVSVGGLPVELGLGGRGVGCYHEDGHLEAVVGDEAVAELEGGDEVAHAGARN